MFLMYTWQTLKTNVLLTSWYKMSVYLFCHAYEILQTYKSIKESSYFIQSLCLWRRNIIQKWISKASLQIFKWTAQEFIWSLRKNVDNICTFMCKKIFNLITDNIIFAMCCQLKQHFSRVSYYLKIISKYLW